MKIAATLIIGLLMTAGIVYSAAAMNRLYYAQDYGNTPGLDSMLAIGYDTPQDYKAAQMTETPAPPPLDSQLPQNLEVASFALG
ncbi:MAG: hypothetical protein R3F46_14415 [bacterium]